MERVVTADSFLVKIAKKAAITYTPSLLYTSMATTKFFHGMIPL